MSDSNAAVTGEGSRKPVLYLVHRLPFPPNKGDKIRSYHLLQYLCRHYDVHLGCFADDPADLQYAADLESICSSVYIETLNPRTARVSSLRGVLTGEPLSLPYYRSRRMQNWVDETLQRESIESCIAFSSPMAQYLLGPAYDNLRRVMDFVDVDSDKWKRYASQRSGPVKWLYAREGQKLEEFECRVASIFDASVFVSDNEVSMFSGISPETSDSHFAISNGVDTEYFEPAEDFSSPYEDGPDKLVFTGMMDYLPNVDAVKWFADEVFPGLRESRPDCEFWIVGGSPVADVLALDNRAGVHVTGRVEDIRPYIRHADVVVAPLRIARGVQNKVLEALAMGKKVVCSPHAAAGLHQLESMPLSVSTSPEEFAEAVSAILDENDPSPAGASRDYVMSHYNWDRNLEKFGQLLRG